MSNLVITNGFNKKDIATDADVTAKTPDKLIDAPRILNENDMASASGVHVASQLSTINYIDSKLAGGVIYRGALALPAVFATMTTNPYLAAETSVKNGDLFVASSAGFLTLSDGQITVGKGDALIINTAGLKTATTVAMIDDISPTYPTVSVGDCKDSWVVADHEGWLLEDGRAISRNIYADLFALIGISQGAGDGSTTFNLPDSRGRVTTGAGQGTGLTNRVLGSKFGTEDEILTIAQMPSHTHDYTYQYQSQTAPYGDQARTVWEYFTNITSTTTATGSGQSHNNMQPSIAKNVFVYVGV